jgi:hypothetical protein
MRERLLKIHTFNVDLSQFPFSPRRDEVVRVRFMDPFGVALLSLLDTTLSGKDRCRRRGG